MARYYKNAIDLLSEGDSVTGHGTQYYAVNDEEGLRQFNSMQKFEGRV